MNAGGTEPSAQQILEEGLRHHQERRFDEARRAYERVVDRDPNNADALHLLGVAALQTSRFAEAVSFLSRAVTMAPTIAEFHNDLGCALRDTKDAAGAVAAWQKAIAVRPDFAEAHRNIADFLSSRGHFDAAIEYYTQAVRAAPDFANAFQQLSFCYQKAGRIEEAIDAMREAVRLRPDLPGWQFRLSALTGDKSITRMPPEFVRNLFNAYAHKFDDHLVSELKYCGPELLLEDVVKATDRTDLEILDLGCGTGLCGVAFRRLAKRLVGVDLSAKMLQAANAREVYDQLIEADAQAVLGSSDQRYDLIVAGDVLIYVGDLSQFMRGAARCLGEGGLLAFSAESYDGRGFHLNENSRFSHSIEYIREVAAGCGLREISARTAPLRRQYGKDVPAWIVVLQKPQ